MKDITTIMYVFLGIDVFALLIMFLMKKFSSNKIVFDAIGLYMFVLCVLLFSVVPNSNMVLKIIATLVFIPGVASFVFREKDFPKARILMSIAIILSTIGLFIIS